MNLVVERSKSAVGDAASMDIVSVDDTSVDDVMLEWAIECLREALWAGQTGQVALYKRALDHVAWVKSERRAGVTANS